MAILEKTIRNKNFDKLLRKLEQEIPDSSWSADLEAGSDFKEGDARCSVRVFERYSMMGGNRLSLTLTLFQNGDFDNKAPKGVKGVKLIWTEKGPLLVWKAPKASKKKWGDQVNRFAIYRFEKGAKVCLLYTYPITYVSHAARLLAEELLIRNLSSGLWIWICLLYTSGKGCQADVDRERSAAGMEGS